MADADIVDRAEQFVWLTARLLDRARFAHLFRGGDRAAVLAALRPYQNRDGGFGNAIEPDVRAPISHPEGGDHAVQILDEVGAANDPMLPPLLDYFASVARLDGGLPFAVPEVLGYPHAPWWQVPDDPPGALLPTAAIVAGLIDNGVTHRWLDRATAFCWDRIEGLEETSPYEARAVLPFLDAVADRERAARAFERLRPLVLDSGMVAYDPHAEGEVHMPLDFAPTPDSLARRLFSVEVIDEQLDALAAAQADDGGWRFNWPVWTPVTEPEWRGWVTIRALKILRAYGRV